MAVAERLIDTGGEDVVGRHVNETRLRLALATANMGTWERNLLTGQDVWSPQQEALFGLTPGSFNTTHEAFLRLVHPDDRAGLEESARRAMEGRGFYRSEYRIVLPDGQTRWMAGTGDVIRDADGKPTHMVGVTKDITERKLAEQRLIAQEGRFRALIEKSFDAVTIVSSKGTIQYATPGVTRMLGYLPQEFVGMNLFDLIHPDDCDRIAQMFARLTAEPGASAVTEYRYLHKNGSYVWVERVATNLLADPAVAGVVINFRDISERKRVEDERARLLAAEQSARHAAESADQTKDAFLATVSHELRTPLTAILGWAQLLRTGNCTPAEAERGLQTVERSARSMSRLVEDVLDVSRIITGKLTLRSDAVDLAAVIDAALDAVRPAAQVKNIRIGRLTGPDPGPITGDSGRLQQIVWNLLMNAIKFTPENGRVQVELDGLDSCARIIVTDNGEGISPEFLPHLFERFTQADNSSRRSHSGLGLGLAIVQQLVELHGGSVEAQSEGLGKGATLLVKLPLTEAAGATTESTCADDGGLATHTRSHDLNGITVVFVDDAADARDFVRKVLADCGARVLTASSAAEALAVIESSAPDVILSDIGMPGQDGYDLIRRVRESERVREVRPVPMAAVTAFARPEDRAKTLDAGFQVHVAKPFNPLELVAIVARLAGRTSASQLD